MEQGLALDELVEDQARRRGTRRIQWASIAVHRRCSMEGYHRRNSPTVEAWLQAGRVIFLGKLGRTAAAAEVLRRVHGCGQGVWWQANATHPWRSIDAVPLSSERSDGDSWSREGDVFLPTLSAAGASLAGGSRCGRRSLGGSTTVGVVRTGLRQGSSNWRSNS